MLDFPIQFWEDPDTLPKKKVVCEQCADGLYQPEDGGNYCRPCPMGSYASSETKCSRKCPAGSRTNRNAAADGCELCPRGSFSDIGGAYNCYACAAGHYADNEGSTECKPCPRRWFIPLSGQYRCAACDPNYYCKSDEGATTCFGDLANCPIYYRVTAFNDKLSNDEIEEGM